MSAQHRPVILCVDDATEVLALLAKVLGAEYEVLTADNPGDAIALAFGDPRPELILLDVDLPEVSGFEVCRALKAEAPTAAIPVIFLTNRTEAEAQLEGLSLGAVDYIGKSNNAALLKARVRMHLAFASQNRQLASRREALEHMLRECTEQLEHARTELIKRLARAMEVHESAPVRNRVTRLSHYAKLICQAAGAKPEVIEMMLRAAPLHDIGKLGVPAEILRKSGKLSVPDWERVKRHPQLGAEIIGEHDDPLLKLARILALTHHEHWDGSGYPHGLKGEAIPWGGRVMAIVDSFEAMTSTQFHREALPVEKAEEEITKAAGRKFDPALVEAFRKALPVMRKVRESYGDQLGDLINLDFSPARGAAPKALPAAAARPGAPNADIAALARARAVAAKSAKK